MKTYFNYISKNYFFSEKIKIRRFIDYLFEKEGIPLKRINYIFCDDEFLLGINQCFLKHDVYTDIITFDLSEENSAITGEVYISIDRIKENAKFFRTATKEELLRVIIHGALHLCGYNDKKKAEKELMRNMENEFIALFLKFK